MSLSSSFLWQPDLYLFEGDFFSLRWYSVLFVLAFLIGRFIVVRSYKVEKRYDISVDIQLIFMILGTLIGSRVGHVIFYEPHILSRGILEMFYFWKGGLASHGAVIGILIAMALYSYKLEFNKFKFSIIDRSRRGYNYLQVMDRLIIVCAIGSALIRMGNFVNSEIIGIPTNSNYGVVFLNSTENNISRKLPFVKSVNFEKTGKYESPGMPILRSKIIFEPEKYKEERIKNSVEKSLGYLLPKQFSNYTSVINPKGSDVEYRLQRSATELSLEFNSIGVYRHPAQLYEAFTYLIIGIIMFLIWQKYKIRLRPGSLLGFCFLTFFSIRFLLEFVKENQVKNEVFKIGNELATGLNYGQALSIPFVIFGAYLLFRNFKKNPFVN